MPTVLRARTIPAPLHQLWDTVADPHHLPRWWPRVVRVEDVTEEAFTEVLSSPRGRLIRADFTLLERQESTHVLHWEQRLESSPFARLLKSAHTRLSLAPATSVGTGEGAGEAGGVETGAATGEATEVTIELSQSLNGFFPRFGSFMVRKAAIQTIEEALDGLEHIAGPA